MRFTPLLILAGSLLAAPVSASVYTVATTGSDSNNGTTAPFRTLQKAVSVLRDGDTIQFQPGTYVAGAYIENRNITVRGLGNVTLDGTHAARPQGIMFSYTSGVTIENLSFVHSALFGILVTQSTGVRVRNCRVSYTGDDGLQISNSSDVVVEGCTAAYNPVHGIYLAQSGDRLTVRNNRVYGNGAAALQVNAVQDNPIPSNPREDGLSIGCAIVGNEIFNNGTAGGPAINLMGVQQSVIGNNLVYANGSAGMVLSDDGAGATYACKNNRILHNTLVSTAPSGFHGVNFMEGCTGNQFLDNIVFVASGSALETSVAVQSNYNCLWGPRIANDGSLAEWRALTHNDLNSIQALPGFTSGYRLGSASPARDSAYLTLATDKVGTLRPQGANPDMGCFEEPASTGSPTGVIYGDALTSGWSAAAGLCSYRLDATTPVFQGSRSIRLTITGANGFLRLGNAGISPAGRTYLKLAVHGGTTGGQAFRVRLFVGGVARAPVYLQTYGGLPLANAWKQYAIPLAALGAGATSRVTGVQIEAGAARSTVYLDSLRLE